MHRDRLAGTHVACGDRFVAGGWVLAAVVNALVVRCVRSATRTGGGRHVAQPSYVIGTDELALVIDTERRTLEVRSRRRRGHGEDQDTRHGERQHGEPPQ